MKPKIGVIVSSTRPTRTGRKIADWFMEQVKDYKDLEFEIIDLKELDLPFLSEPESAASGNYTQEKSIAWSKQVAGLDGFVFVTAEYNYGPPAPLKNAIDTLYHEWNRKPVAYVGYGTFGGTRAVEHLGGSVARVGMMSLSQSFIGILSPWMAIAEDGSVKPEFVHGHVDIFLENLTWWAKTLKVAREQ